MFKVVAMGEISG